MHACRRCKKKNRRQKLILNFEKYSLFPHSSQGDDGSGGPGGGGGGTGVGKLHETISHTCLSSSAEYELALILKELRWITDQVSIVFHGPRSFPISRYNICLNRLVVGIGV